jgi:adenylate cyclase
MDRCVWDVMPIDNSAVRLQDSLQHGAKHYVPEQSLRLALASDTPPDGDPDCVLAMADADQVIPTGSGAEWATPRLR